HCASPTCHVIHSGSAQARPQTRSWSHHCQTPPPHRWTPTHAVSSLSHPPRRRHHHVASALPPSWRRPAHQPRPPARPIARITTTPPAALRVTRASHPSAHAPLPRGPVNDFNAVVRVTVPPPAAGGRPTPPRGAASGVTRGSAGRRWRALHHPPTAASI